MAYRLNVNLANNYLKFLLKKKQIEFTVNEYLPELKKAMQYVKIPWFFRLSILCKSLGVVTKIGYAFLWQEDKIKSPYFTSKYSKIIGALLIPVVNVFSNFLTGFNQTDYNVTFSFDLYPG